MTTFYAILCGALTSAAWVAPKPLCYVFGVISFGLFVLIRSRI
jgi:hypothetical protein